MRYSRVRRAKNLLNSQQLRPQLDSRKIRSSLQIDRNVALRKIDDIDESLFSVSGKTYHIAIDSISSTNEVGAALIAIIVKNKEGRRISLAGWPNYSRRVGEYIYLNNEAGTGTSFTEFTISLPKEAHSLSIAGHTWKANTSTFVVGGVIINELGADTWQGKTDLGSLVYQPLSYMQIDLTVPEGATSLDAELHVMARDRDANSPIAVSFYDVNGSLLLPPSDLPQHANYGAYVLAKAPKGERAVVPLNLTLPKGVNKIRLQGTPVGSSGSFLVEYPYVSFQVDKLREFESFLQSVPNDRKLIILDTTAPPLGHKSLALRPNNMTEQYAALGYYVLFLPFGSLQGHQARVSDQVFQFDRTWDTREMDALLRRYRRGKGDIYICSSFPSVECVTRAYALKAVGFRVVYEVRDDMEEFNRVGYSKWYNVSSERALVGFADKVITVSPSLSDKVSSLLPYDRQVHTIPNGVNPRTITEGSDLRTGSIRDVRSESSIVGYIGHLTDSWFDWELVLRAADKLPHVHFQIIGHGLPDWIRLPSNIEYLGGMSHSEAKDYAKYWKVGIIPFIDSPLTRSVDPNKLYEYFSWGLRVVSAPMGMVDKYASTWVYHNSDEFIGCLKEALSSQVSDDELAVINFNALHSSWLDRAKSMINVMESGS